MRENEIAKIVVNTAFQIHSKTGRGCWSRYEEILCYELTKQGLFVERQKRSVCYLRRH